MAQHQVSLSDFDIEIHDPYDVTAEYPARTVTLHTKTEGGTFITVTFGVDVLEQALDTQAEAQAEFQGANA